MEKHYLHMMVPCHGGPCSYEAPVDTYKFFKTREAALDWANRENIKIKQLYVLVETGTRLVTVGKKKQTIQETKEIEIDDNQWV